MCPTWDLAADGIAKGRDRPVACLRTGPSDMEATASVSTKNPVGNRQTSEERMDCFFVLLVNVKFIMNSTTEVV